MPAPTPFPTSARDQGRDPAAPPGYDPEAEFSRIEPRLIGYHEYMPVGDSLSRAIIWGAVAVLLACSLGLALS